MGLYEFWGNFAVGIQRFFSEELLLEDNSIVDLGNGAGGQNSLVDPSIRTGEVGG